MKNQNPSTNSGQAGSAKIVMIILVFVIVGAVGYVFRDRFVSTSSVDTDSREIGGKKNGGADTGGLVVSDDTTADWKTYVDSEYGFQFKYPAHWNKRNLSFGSNSSIEGILGSDIVKHVAVWRDDRIMGGFTVLVVKNVSCDSPKDWLDSSISVYLGRPKLKGYSFDMLSEGTFNLAGSAHKKIDYLRCGNGFNIICLARQNICIPRSGVSLILVGEAPFEAVKATDVEEDKILNSILSSFQLTK